MHFFRSWKRQPARSSDAASHPQQHPPQQQHQQQQHQQQQQQQRLYGHVNYTYNSPCHAAELSSKPLPVTPPPEYQKFDSALLHQQYLLAEYSCYARSLSTGTCHSSPEMQPPPLFGGSWMTSTSTIDITRPRTAGGSRQEHGSQTRRGLAPRPSTRARDGPAVAPDFVQGAAFCDKVASRLSHVLLRADEGVAGQDELEVLTRGLDLSDRDSSPGPIDRSLSTRGRRTEQVERSTGGLINFKKAWLYQNSRLPPGMLPCNLYLPTWRLACRAAQASIDVYHRPRKDQRDDYTSADSKQGTKAMIIQSQPVDDSKLIIVAIRGSQNNISDWSVNFGASPVRPTGFLDDEGNACHGGLLQVTRAMVGTIATQLRQRVEDDPSLASCSILFTGHSAGGAVASLLYMHMLSRTVVSDLTLLANVFKRVHCITFGTPPLSLLPLQAPRGRKADKNLFLSFANEGDCVIRADMTYVRSLARLVAAPAPKITKSRPGLVARVSRRNLKNTDDEVATPSPAVPPRWPVPDSPLSNPGRMVLLREKPRTTTTEAIEAVWVTDGELRDVIFGDPAMHAMALYQKRVKELAFAAVLG